MFFFPFIDSTVEIDRGGEAVKCTPGDLNGGPAAMRMIVFVYGAPAQLSV